MRDEVMDTFLRRQLADGLALARRSDILELLPLDGSPPDRHIARFNCRGLVRAVDGRIADAHRFEVGVTFPPEYLRHVESLEMLTWLAPADVFHPNISPALPVICAGHIIPGTGLVDLLYQLYEIVSWQRYTADETDALNRDACLWARNNRSRLPLDARPLTRAANAPLATEPKEVDG